MFQLSDSFCTVPGPFNRILHLDDDFPVAGDLASDSRAAHLKADGSHTSRYTYTGVCIYIYLCM